MKLSEFAKGTYAAFKLDTHSVEALYEFCKSLGIDNLVQADDYHCTILYSKVHCPDIAHEKMPLPCTAKAISYEMFGEDEGALVLKVDCKAAVQLHKTCIEKYGATHSYDEYVPHITLAYDFSGPLPKQLPDVDIIFTKFIIEDLEND
jgi:hypothetical protein